MKTKKLNKQELIKKIIKKFELNEGEILQDFYNNIEDDNYSIKDLNKLFRYNKLKENKRNENKSTKQKTRSNGK